MDSEMLEKYSSAITLSDMEVFVFPELMYSLVLANIMSPVIWQWRELECFKKLEGKSSYKKLMRLKQFIIDEYEFNLDLETWGLTSQDVELKRFQKLISPEQIAQSNALFGYHGDKYYFDVDIRRHFGLDKYDSDIIPYWKTETVESMDAFKLKPGYNKAAGECVSLAALYAAAAFVICRIPLEDIYMILTPLHSQNFLDLNDGVLTNNRRLVTKTMWFNGTAITNKAQRAIRNEQVTIVAHNTGYVHCLYGDATIEEEAYLKFNKRLTQYLSTDVTTLTLANFLRSHAKYQPYFQFCCEYCRGGPKFAKAEVLFHYEHDSNFRIADDTFDKLIAEVSDEDVLSYKVPGRICVRQLVNYIKYDDINLKDEHSQKTFTEFIAPYVPDTDNFLKDLLNFIYVEPKLPNPEKNFIRTQPITLPTGADREQVIEALEQLRTVNITADLAFYAYRDMKRCDWAPFVKAAVERNPVAIQQTEKMTLGDVHNWLQNLGGISIYQGSRLAQPDEVANYMTGDGLEKAFLLANIIHARRPEQKIEINVNNSDVTLKAEDSYAFNSNKGLKKTLNIPLP